MATLPLGLLSVARQSFFDANGEPLSNGYLLFYETGTVTPADVFADADGNTSLGPRVDLDVAGLAPQIFVGNFGYRVRLFDEDDNQIWSADQVESPGDVFAATSGAIQGEGSKSVGDAYVTDADDNLVTVASTAAPFNITVGQTATARGLPLIILNAGDQVVSVNVLGGQTLNGQSGPLDIPASTGAPNYPGVILYPVAPSSWFAVSCPAFA